MLTANLGPLPVPISLLLLLVALLVATGVGRLVGRGQQTGIGNILTDMLIAAVLVARIAFVGVWFDTYRSTPWSMLDIRDGGFTPWAGMVAALLVAIWRGWRRAALRKPLTLGLAAGALAWGAMFGAILMIDNTALPKVSLTTLAGEPADLAALAAGKPMVVNCGLAGAHPAAAKCRCSPPRSNRKRGCALSLSTRAKMGRRPSAISPPLGWILPTFCSTPAPALAARSARWRCRPLFSTPPTDGWSIPTWARYRPPRWRVN